MNLNIKCVLVNRNGIVNAFLPNEKTIYVENSWDGFASLKALVNSYKLMAEK